MMPDPSDKQAHDNASPSGSIPSRSGEGSDTALQALIKTRKSKGDDPPAADADPGEAAGDAAA